MKKNKLFPIIFSLLILTSFVCADWYFNPETGKIDYTIFAGTTATGDILYHDGTNWVVLNVGANGQVFTLAAGLPSWAAAGAPGLHAASHEIAGADLVDHDNLTNFVANEHLLPAAIDHNALLNYVAGQHIDVANVFYVSATGGDYTTIQAALTAQSVGGELFLVAPGTYTGDTINFTANNQCVRGMGNVNQTVITAADAAIVNFGAYTNCRIEMVQISMTAPTTAKDLITGSGSLFLYDVDLVVTNTLVTGADQPTAIDTTGTVIMTRGQITYTNSGDDGDGATAIKAAIRVSGTAMVTLDYVMLDIDGSGQSLAIAPAFGTAGDVNMYRCSIDVDDDAATYTVGFIYTNIVGATHEFMGNDLHINNSANTAVGIWLASSESVRSMYNHYHITGGTANSFNIAAGATVISQLDDIVAAGGMAGAGTLTMVSSEADGNFTISGLTASHPVFTDANDVLVSTGTMPVDQGGTNMTSYTIGDIVYASTAGILSGLADVALGQVLISGGVGVAPSWSGTPSVLTLDVNYGGATGETGVDFNSINSTFSTIAQSDAEGIANKSDLRIGLDDDNPTLILMTRDDIMDDFGLSAASSPIMYIYNAAGTKYISINYLGLANSGEPFKLTTKDSFVFQLITNDLDSGHLFTFDSSGARELTDANAQQSWVYINPKNLQTSTAAVDFLYVNVDTANLTYGDGTTGDGNNLFRLAIGGTSRFKTDIYGYTKAGLASGALNDNATYATTIPDSWTGIIIVQNTTDTTSGVYHLDGTAIAAINQNAAFTVTQGTDNKINVYVAGNVLTVENTHAAAKTVKVMFIGT